MQYISINDAAKVLKVNRRTIYMLVKSGEIPAIRVGSQWRIPESFLEEGTENNKNYKEEEK